MRVWGGKLHCFDQDEFWLPKALQSGRNDRISFVLFGLLFFLKLMFCFRVHSLFTLGRILPKPFTLTHHVVHSPSFAVHPLKSNIIEAEEQEDVHTVIQIKLAGVYFAFQKQNV